MAGFFFLKTGAISVGLIIETGFVRRGLTRALIDNRLDPHRYRVNSLLLALRGFIPGG